MSPLFDLIKDLLYFPVWWYGRGLQKRWKIALKEIKDGYRNLALKILILNLFKPMYGEKDRQGRIISFFARLIMLLGRSVEMLIWVLFIFILLAIWTIAPLFVVRQILFLL